MSSIRSAQPLGYVLFVSSIAALVLSACSSSSTSRGLTLSSGDSGDTCTPVVATGAATTSSGAATCGSPGEATTGPADTHCKGMAVQSTSAASCCHGGDAGGPGTCPYAATMFGHEGDDDDCKYHVVWSSTPICEGSAGVQVTAVATYLGSGKPVTGANIRPEVFTTSPPDAGCDDMSSHESPSTFSVFSETTEGTYVGRVVFDTKGEWTMRFHLFENCYDVLDDSPHGHAAFHVTVP